MIKPGKPIGFLIGFLAGIYARDNFLYPYPLRVHDLQQAFEKQKQPIEAKEAQLINNIKTMTRQLDEAQGKYIGMKHMQYIDDDKGQNQDTGGQKNENKKVKK